LHHALHNRLNELATDTGRLKRRLDPASGAYWISERIADHIEAITSMVEPTAAELAAWTAPGQDEAIAEAIAIVDARYRSLQQRLRREP
jgi:hypothetical protein